MKIAIAQQHYQAGGFDANKKKIIEGIEKSIEAKADLVVFGELCVPGYCHYDDIFYESFIEESERVVESLLPFSKKIAIIVGAPRKNTAPLGKKFYNSAFVLQDGKIERVIDKTLLPYFDIFEEEKYYERGTDNTTAICIAGKEVVLNICADMWAYYPHSGYNKNPIREICQHSEKKDLIINISASPANYGRLEERKQTIRNIIAECKLPMIYCNIVGGYDEVVFDGQSMVFNAQAKPVLQMKAFEEDFRIVDTERLEQEDGAPIPSHYSPPPAGKSAVGYLTDPHHIKEICDILVYGFDCFLKSSKCDKILIASSGGIDSGVCLALASLVLPKEHITSLALPSPFSSAHSKADAKELAHRLQIRHIEFSIEDTYRHFVDKFSKDFSIPSLKDVALENIQSRIRGLLGMTLANHENCLLINTSNKSELSTGYGTLYGDMIGAVSPLGDVFKTQVYALAKYLNEKEERIPLPMLEKEPSAELKENQKDTDTLPSYNALDSILYFFLHQNKGKEELVRQGFERADVEKIIALFKRSQFKRKQFCPILRVSNKAFGQGRKHIIADAFDYR